MNTVNGLAEDLRRVAATGLPRRDRDALLHAAHILKAMGPGVEIAATPNPSLVGVMELVAAERGRQDAKYGTGADIREQTRDRWLAILTERALRSELVQVAAVAARWLELGDFSL